MRRLFSDDHHRFPQPDDLCGEARITGEHVVNNRDVINNEAERVVHAREEFEYFPSGSDVTRPQS